MASNKQGARKTNVPLNASASGKFTLFAAAQKNLEDLIQDYDTNRENPSADRKEKKPASTGSSFKPNSGKAGLSKPVPKPVQGQTKPPGQFRGKPDVKPSKPDHPKPGAGSAAISSEKEKKEYFESEEGLSQKLDQLSQWIKESNHCIVFTGAGISTSTGIPDFRSGMNTVLDTGPGVWELRAHGLPRSTGAEAKVKSSLKAVPSKAHMAILKLLETGFLKFVVSQNTDGLHRRSGVHPDSLAELHGNTNKETCTKCGLAYMRDFRTRNAAKVHNHRTGRYCDNPKCHGPLVDSIINFGEDLPEDELNKGFNHGRKADLCIVLGSSLRVTPAADIPEEIIMRGGKVVICNLQKTPLNSTCALEIHAKTDDVMSGVMQRLDLQIPPFKLKRCVAMDTTAEGEISVMGVDPNRDIPFSFLTKIKIVVPKLKGLAAEFNKEPALLKLPNPLCSLIEGSGLEVHISLMFQGHYNEPDITLQYKVVKPGRNLRIIEFDPLTGQWDLTDSDYRI